MKRSPIAIIIVLTVIILAVLLNASDNSEANEPKSQIEIIQKESPKSAKLSDIMKLGE